MMRRHSERGNIFFMLFGAVALVGVVAAATSTLMRGPLSTVVNVNARAKADTQMQIAAKLAMVRASQQSGPGSPPAWSSGDCDSDGNVEPIPAKDASPKPQGGGQLPESIGAAQLDPWGNAYGYCVWDIGTKNADAACAVGAGEVTRLKGDYNNNYPVMMIVSSGPDRTFQTQCNDWVTTSPGNDPLVNNYPTNYVGTMTGQHASAVTGDVIYKPVGSDDIVISYSYDQASQVAGGLWSLMKTDPSKITTNKDVDIQTNANFASGKTATFQGAAQFDPGSRLDLGFGRTGADTGGLFKLPDQTSLTTCNSANNGALRLNTIATPNHNSLEVCDGLTGSPSWVAPSSTGITVTKLDDLTDAIASSVVQHKNLMLGDGTGLNFASSSTADNNVGVGIGSLSSLAAAGTVDNVVVGSLSGTTLTTGSHNIIVGSALEAPTATTSGFLSIGNMIYATGMNGTGTTISAGNVGIGTANPSAKLQVAGATQATQFQFDTNNYLGYSSGGDISLTYGGASQLLANSNGIGIGMSPAHLLDVNGDAYAQRFISTFSSASALPSFTFSGDVNTGIAHPSAGQIAFTLAGSEKAILTSTGLGIGVTSPSVALDVSGAGAFTTTVNAGTAFQFGSSNGMYNQGGNLSFNTGGSPRIYVTSVGLGVGLATPMVSLDAAGAIRPGTATDGSCTTGSYGAIRYGSGDALQYCSTDNNWYSLVASGGGGGGANLWTNNTTYITRANAHFINSGQALPAALSSGGSRFFWYPDKSSFRAGGDGGTAWTDGNIGNYSIGLGYDTEAKGNSSFAAGNNIAATGNYSFGIGQNLTASNTNSFALGNNNVASGTSAIAMGQKVTASGNYAMALGLGNSTTAPTVTGTDSFGIFMGDMSNKSLTGNNTMALLGGKFLVDATPAGATSAMTGTLSFQVNGDAGAAQYCDNTGAYCFTAQSIATGAVGVFENAANVIRLTSGTVNYASANYVFGSPQLTDDGDATHRNRFYFIKSTGAFRAGGTSGTEWDTAGNYSTGFGYGVTATGDYSFTAGRLNTATNAQSIALGYGVNSTGDSSIALGSLINASGNYSAALGHKATASGPQSFAFGLGDPASNPIVSGTNSFGIFMGDQGGVTLGAGNTMLLAGGKFVIDPKTPATQLTARGVLDLGAATDAMVMPVGTTAQKPTGVNAVNGMIRYNTDNGKFEAYQAGAWQDILTSAVVGGAAAPDRGIQFNSGNNFAASSNMIYTSAGAFMVSGTAGTLSLPATGAGTRMFFDPNSAVFRAGKVSGTQWDSANVGTNSVAFGNNTIASGLGAVAIGATTTASGTKSLAMGDSTIASGTGSIAAGVLSMASGIQSIALGYNNTASGDTAIAMGWGSLSSGATSIAVGNSVIASGANATGIGYGNAATGLNSVALGNFVTAGNGTAASGFGNYSMAIGLTSTNVVHPQVTGSNALGIFMGNQSGVVFASSNSVGFFGGSIVIDPTAPATYLAARTALDINGSIKISDGGETCATLLKGAIRYTSANTLQYCNGTAWTSTASSGTNVLALDDLSDAIVQYASNNMYLGNNSGATTTTAVGNTVLGSGAMTSVTIGGFNTALGTSAMQVVTSGEQNVAVGHEALFTNTTGSFNTALGRMALQGNNASFNTATGFASLQSNTTGINNTGTGSSSLVSNTTGSNNVAFGFSALFRNVAGSESTAIGSSAMLNANSSVTAFTTYNTAVGAYAMQGSGTPANNIGVQNTAIGHSAMLSMTSGSQNVAVGTSALYLLSTGSSNTAVGQGSLFQATSGSNNTAIGQYSMGTLSSGTDNVAVGRAAISDLTIGATNVAVGNAALNHVTGSSNVAVGHTAMSGLVAGSFNTALGYNAGSNLTAGSNNIAIGNGITFANSTGSNQLNIANLLTGDVSSGLAYISSNAAVMLPVGTTAQRPLAGVTVNGMIRYNNQSGKFEGYQGGTWQDILTSAVAGGAAAPDRGIQFNSGNSFAASSNLTYTSAGVLTAVGTYSGVVSTVPSGAGARMFFDPASGAFRAGYIGGTTWDAANIGTYSFAAGNSTKALGTSAVALNYFTTAPGPYATALGNSTTANGSASIALGQATTTGSSAVASFAGGYFTTANGNYSFAMGQGNTAGGIASMALGGRVNASGNYSTAIGFISASGTAPQVSGTGSFGLFMQDQSGVTFASSNTMGLFGGKFVIDPAAPATYLVPQTALDINGSIKIGDGSETCSSIVKGAMRYTSAGLLQYCNSTAWSTIASTGSTVAAGSTTQIQYNSGGVLAASGTLTFVSGSMMNSGTYTGTASLPATGAGSRMFFDPASAAFRAGYVSATQWDAVNTGTYSFAEGYNATASGQYSAALGYQPLATGQYSLAFGSSSATNTYSIAMGQNNFSSGAGSIVMGQSSAASGLNAISIGLSAVSSGAYDVVIGKNNTVSNTSVMAIGTSNTVGGDGTLVFGNNITVGTNATNSLGLGNNVTIGLAGSNTSAALGLGTPAAGHYPRVGGSNSFGIFMGSQTDVHFDSSNAMGVFGGKLVVDPAVPATYLIPQTALDVHGSIKIGDGSETCSSTTAGAMRYTSAGTMQYCNSSTWTALVTGGTIVAAGVNTNIQFNSGGSFWGDSNLDYSSGSFINKGTYTSAVYVPATGAGSRMFFDPASGALRAGVVTGTQWNATNVGTYSFAGGLDTRAKGAASVALGSLSFASGDVSFAMGDTALASGNDSVAIGPSATATGFAAVALGQTTAGGDNSFATGYGGVASGPIAMALGYNNVSSGNVSVALGWGTQALGDQSFAAGNSTIASGAVSTAIGYYTSAGGFGSTAIGNYVRALGDQSVAFGLTPSTAAAIPKVTGTGSFGVFMGANQTNVNFASSNTMGVFGGRLVIDPNAPATQLAARGVLDLGAANDAMVMPLGTTGQRPTAVVNGMVRYNTSSANFEGYQNGSWLPFSSASSGATAAAGSNLQLQFNSGGVLGASANMTFSSATNILAVTGAVSVTDRVSIAGTTGMSAPSGIALADLSDVTIGSPASGKVLAYNGSAWTATTLGSSSVTAAGATTNVQFNSSGAFAGTSNFTWTDTTGMLSVSKGYQFAGSTVFTYPKAAADATGLAIGPSALAAQTASSGKNVAVGSGAGQYLTTGTENTALGYIAMQGISGTPLTGGFNTAIGSNALITLQAAADNNTGIGEYAGNFISTGDDNTAIGGESMYGVTGAKTTGSENTALGYQAGYKIQGAASNNTMLGSNSGKGVTTGSNNIILGYSAASNLTTSSSNIMIGYNIDAQSATVSNQMSIGNLIFASGGFGTSTTVGTGWVGIRTASPRVTLDITGTDAMMIPAGSTANRPGTSVAVNGMMRYNTGTANFEGYQNGSWLPFSSAAAGAAAAAGATTQIQYNSSGVMSASSGLVFSSGALMNTGTYSGNASVPATGTGSRMFFDPASGAFRAGVVDTNMSTAWDAANIGAVSVAIGNDVKASNVSSIAIGVMSVSSGQESIAIGQQVNALSDGAVAIGYNSTVNSSSAVAIGSTNTVGTGAPDSKIFGTGSSIGNNANNAIALGTNVSANGAYSMAIGLGASATTYPIVSGASSMGIFMGNQKNVTFASANSMGLFGGKFVIDPGVQATYLYPRTALDVNGSIKVGDGAETCGTTLAGAIRYNTGTLQYCNGTTWTLTSAGATSTPAGSTTQVQYNSGGSVFGASANYTYDYTNNILTVANSGTGSIRAGAGTALLPSLSFAGDTDTGLFNSAANILDVSVGGGDVLQFASTALGVNYFKMTAGTAANGPILTNAGSATNGAGLSLNINAKTATAAGVGGAVNITGGGGNGANAGGVTYVQGGTGGATGNGGDATLSGGLGGATSGTGGQASLIGGSGNGAGGVAYVAGGNGAAANAGGNAYLQGGGGGTGTAAGGGAYIAGGAGAATSGAGGPIFVTGGNATSGAGGNVTVGAGSTAAGAGGNASFYATDGVGGSNAGGAVSIGAGDSLGATTGGATDIFAGTTVSGTGGGASLNAGYGGTTGAGGTVSIIAGAGGGTSGNGGNVVLTAGSVTSGTAGSILGKIGATTYMTIQPPGTTSSSVVFSGTGAVTLPIGITSQQPSVGVDGMIRYNSSKLAFEGRQNGSWLTFASGTAGAATLNGIGAATASQAGIDNTNNTIVWNWSTLTSGSALTLANTSTAANANTALTATNATTGAGSAIVGSNTSSGNTGAGVKGTNVTTGLNYGVWGTNTSATTGASAIYAQETSTTGNVNGLWATVSSTGTGASGVWGQALGTSGLTYGVTGSTASTTAAASGVYGVAMGASGATYGVYGSNASSTGYGGYFDSTAGGVALYASGGSTTGSSAVFGGNAITLPASATRPSAAVNGMVRYNTSSANFEGYQNGSWLPFSSASAGATSAAGSSTYVQFNSGGVLAGTSNFTWTDSTGMLNVSKGYQFAGTTILTYPKAATDITGLAFGSSALAAQTAATGYNVAIGMGSQQYVTTGAQNVSLGYTAMQGVSGTPLTGSFNTALGQAALSVLQGAAANNTALGEYAGYFVSTGSANTAVGGETMYGVTGAKLTGSNNTAVGYAAAKLLQGAAANNTNVGAFSATAITTGSDNITLGYSNAAVLTTGSNNIVIGDTVNLPAAATSSYMSIGNLIFASGGFGTGTSVGTGWVGIRTASPRVTLDITGTDAMMIPAGNNSTNRPAASAVANGMIRYNTTDTRFEGYQNGSWLPFSSGGAAGSSTLGTATSAASPQISGDATSGFYTAGAGLVDVTILGSKMVEFSSSWVNFTSSNYGIRIGGLNGMRFPTSDSTAGGSIAIGTLALNGQTSSAAYGNTAVGYQAIGNGTLTTAAVSNTAIGYTALAENTTGSQNTALGNLGLIHNTTGTQNVAIGNQALQENRAKQGSTAVGYNAMLFADSTTTASVTNNTAVGQFALMGSGVAASNTGTSNTALGANALTATTSGSNNTAVGANALGAVTTGSSNLAFGSASGDSITTGSSNIIIGANIDAQVGTASNQMSIGNLIFASGGFGTSTTVGTGWVGIRTASPRVTLDITGTDAMMIPAGNNSTNRPAASAVANGMIRYNTTDTRFEGYQNGSWLPFSSSSASTAPAAGSNLQVQINNGGVMGATSGLTFTSATNTLTVGGTVSITGTSGLTAPTGLALSNLSDVSVTGLASGKVLTYNGTAWAPATPSSGGTPGGSTTQIQYNNAGAFAGDSALIWDNTNKFLSVNTASPNSNIHITATSFNAMRLQNAPSMDVYVDVLTTDAHNPYLRFGTNNISKFSIGANDADGTFRIGAANDFSTTLLMLDGSGNLTVANNISYSGVLTDTSDRRLKTDIHALRDKGSMLDRINQIDTFTYRMKKDQKLVQYGVMAQQIKDIFPELVITDTKTPENYMSVNYTGLIAPLIESTKELKAQNDNLKSRVAELESQQKETHADIESLSKDIKGMKAYTGYGIGKAGMDGWMMLMMGLVFGGGGMAFAYRSGIRVRRQK